MISLRRGAVNLRRKRRTERTTPAEKPIPVLTTALLMQRSVCSDRQRGEQGRRSHVSSAGPSTVATDARDGELTFCEMMSSDDTLVLDVEACCDAIVAVV